MGQYSPAVVALTPSRQRSCKQLGARVSVSRDAWVRLGVCSATAALLQIDGTLITVALPSVARGLGMSRSSTSLILGAYFAAYAIALLPGGALVDRLGIKPAALIGLLFGVGAASGALANGFGVLVVTRVVQGAGAGLVSPAALAGAVSGFPPERRGAALGIWGPVRASRISLGRHWAGCSQSRSAGAPFGGYWCRCVHSLASRYSDTWHLVVPTGPATKMLRFSTGLCSVPR